MLAQPRSGQVKAAGPVEVVEGSLSTVLAGISCWKRWYWIELYQDVLGNFTQVTALLLPLILLVAMETFRSHLSTEKQNYQIFSRSKQSQGLPYKQRHY